MVLFVLPIMIFSGVFFANTQDQLVNEILSNQRYAITQAVRDLNQHVDEFRTIATRLSYNEYVTPYKISRGGLSKMEAVRQIGSYHSLNNFFDQLLIYYFDQALVMSNAGESQLNVFIGHEYTLAGSWNMDGFTSFLTETSGLRFSAPGCTLVKQSNQVPYVVIANRMPIYSDDPFACTAALIRQDYFTGLLSGIVGDIIGAAYILDSDGRILFQSSNGMTLSEATIVRSFEQVNLGENQIRIDGKLCSVTGLLNPISGWTFLAIFPQIQFFNRFLNERWLALTAIALAVLLGITMVVYIALRNYKPINKLKAVLKGNLALDQGVGEMSSIQQAVLHITERNRLLALQADENRAMIASNLINCIVSGTAGIDTQEFAAKLAEAGITLPGPNYAMAAVRIPKPVSSSETETMISNIFAHSAGAAYGFSMAYYKTTAVLINFTDENSLDKIVQSLSAIAEAVYNCLPVIGIGSPSSTLKLLNQSLMEAVAAIESHQAEDSRIIRFSELRTWKQKQFWYPMEAQLRLCQAIRHSNRDVADQAISELSRMLSTIYVEENKIVLNFIISGCTAQILQLADELDCRPDPALIGQLVNFITLEEYVRLLSSLSILLLDCVDNRKTDSKVLLYMNIKTYIDEHFASNNLSLNEVADKFAMTPSSLSKFFRHYEGVNFIEYITMRRFEAACNLLRNTDDPIKKIMEQIGYNDLASFTRKFKSAIGTSPGKYREINRVNSKS
jgi:AraC-like DNA-binding protein